MKKANWEIIFTKAAFKNSKVTNVDSEDEISRDLF